MGHRDTDNVNVAGSTGHPYTLPTGTPRTTPGGRTGDSASISNSDARVTHKRVHGHLRPGYFFTSDPISVTLSNSNGGTYGGNFWLGGIVIGVRF